MKHKGLSICYVGALLHRLPLVSISVLVCCNGCIERDPCLAICESKQHAYVHMAKQFCCQTHFSTSSVSHCPTHSITGTLMMSLQRCFILCMTAKSSKDCLVKICTSLFFPLHAALTITKHAAPSQGQQCLHPNGLLMAQHSIDSHSSLLPHFVH